MRGFNVNEEASPEKSTQRANPSVRFYAKIAEKPELLSLDPEKIDRNWKNALQDCNLQFTLVYRDHLNGNAYVMKTLEAPSFIGGDVWDICFFCSPFVIETNVFLTKEPRSNDFFSYY